jgi:hypothetical protein
VVVRVSNRLLPPVEDRPFENVVRVEEFLFNTSAAGLARTTGLVSLAPDPSEPDLAFSITVRGTSAAEMTGQNGPAILHTLATTDFTATKKVVYNRSRSAFESRPTSVAAQTSCRLRGIDSTAGGIIGRLVEGIAQRRFECLQPQIDQAALQSATRRIAAQVDHRVDAMLGRVNENLYLLEPAVREFREVSDYEIAVSTTGEYVQAAVQRVGADAPVRIPAKAQDEHLVEVWLHRSLISAADRMTWKREWPPVEDAMIDVLCAVTGGDGLRDTARSPVEVRDVGDWIVIGVELEPDELGLTAQAESGPSTAPTITGSP